MAAALVALVVSWVGCAPSGGGDDKPRFAFVTNMPASFWVIAQKGVEKAGEDLDVHVSVDMPADGVTGQKRVLEDLLARGVQGIAVSVIDPANQTDILNEVAGRTTLITHDADAPDSERMVYIGMDNYTAGRMCGELVKEALPNGGKVMIFVGRVEQDNGRRRRQGVIDELLTGRELFQSFEQSGVRTRCLVNGLIAVLLIQLSEKKVPTAVVLKVANVKLMHHIDAWPMLSTVGN